MDCELSFSVRTDVYIHIKTSTVSHWVFKAGTQ